ncbi:hypothetical protein DN730_08165 [Marinomonas piezotolerans]|uniref:Helicase ATP-binding domain-containing protein n=1 Tax=Marinomonas piezotolerans TaxID=2213058 RepID=A0A370U9A7_9GAMM|nr:LPD38 domain-containing protein [Marinomonas piezotolerans]RDL44369.1 hypothetical protein DN730_08165 [Marinomonas piezotolerans]
MSEITREEIQRKALIRKQIREKANSEQEDEQGFFGDAVDAMQHGFLSGAADLADGIGYLTGSETASDTGEWLRGHADNQIEQMSTQGREAFEGFGVESDDDSITGYGLKDSSSLKGFGLNVLSGVGSFAPTMIPGGLAAKGVSTVGKVTGGVAKGTKAASVIDKSADVVGFGGVGAATIGGSTGNQAKQEIMNATPADLKDAPLYQDHYRALRNSGTDHKTAMYQARENLANDVAELAAQDGAKLGAVTQGALGPVMGKLFRGEGGTWTKSIATGAATEGSQEFVESGGQTAVSNRAVNPVLPRDTMDGVVEDAISGAMIGGPVGGAFAAGGKAASRNKPQPEAAPDPNDPLSQPDAPETPQDKAQAELDQIDDLLTNEAETLNDEEYEAFLARRDELLQILDVGDQDSQPFDMAGPEQTQAQQFGLSPNGPVRDDTEYSRNQSAFERQHGTARNTSIDGEYIPSQQPETNYSWENRLGRIGETVDGELLRDPQQVGRDEKQAQQVRPQEQLAGPRGLGLTPPSYLRVEPERTQPNREAVSYSQINSEGAFLDAPSLRPEQRQQQEGRQRRTKQQTEFGVPQQSVIAEPYRPTETELAARETTRRSFEEPVTEVRQSRKARDEAYQLQKLQERQLVKSRLKQRLRETERRKQENQVALGQLEVGSEVKAAKGNKAKAYTPNNKAIDVEYQIVEASDLTTSHDDHFQARTDYPQALQNRDRSSPALRKQVEDNAKNLIPEKLGEDSGVVSGAPIIRNGVVESGNGRTMSIRRAYNDNGAANYLQYLEDNVERLGINKDELSQFNQPVLVRQRLNDMTADELTSYTKDANTTDAFALNPVEQAKSDSNRLSDDDMALIDIPESGDFAAASNRSFVRKFLSRFPKAEQNAMLNGDGTISDGGISRVQNAIFAKAYGSDQLIEDITSTSADDMKTVAKALINAAPEVAKLNAQGGVEGFTDTIVDAVNIVKRSRRDDVPVKELTDQFDLMSENTVDPTTASLANYLDQNVRSIKRMTDAIKGAAQRGQEGLRNSQTDGLFGRAPAPTVANVLDFGGESSAPSGKQNSDTGKQSSDISEQNTNIGKENAVTAPIGNTETVNNAQPEIEQSDEPQVKLQKSGRPYSSEKVARMSQTFKNTPNAEIVPYQGGFGIIEGKKPKPQSRISKKQAANIKASVQQSLDKTSLVKEQGGNSASYEKHISDTIKAVKQRDTVLADELQKMVDEHQVEQPKKRNKLDQAADSLSSKKREKAEKLANLMKSRRGQLNSGIDPEVMLAVAELGAVTIAEGTVRFARWARDVLNATRAVGIQDEDVKPFLKEAYGAVSANPEKYEVSDDLADQMDAPRDVRKFDLNRLEDEADVSTTSGEVERAGTSQDQAQVDQDSNGNESEPTRRSSGRAERTTTKAVRPNRSDSVPVRDGAVSGEGSTGSLFESDGSAAAKASISDPRELGRSDSDDDGGVSFDPTTAAATSEATGRVEQADTQTAPPAKHKAKWGDVADIQQSVPALMPEQANDVSLIEKRLFDETSSTNGYLNTNGTGTGKTFVGLGTIKRLSQQGMSNTLVVLPSDGIARQWVQAAKDFFDLDAYVLGDNGGAKLKDAGKGLTITTYATFGQNNELIKQRKTFDLIVADESQKLMGGQQAKNTAALNMLRAHTNHEQGSYHRARSVYADEQEAVTKKVDAYAAKVLPQFDGDENKALLAAQERYKDDQSVVDNKVRKLRDKLKEQGPFDTKVLFLSATPFPYVRNTDYAEGYLFRYEDYGDKYEGGYENAFHGHNAFYIRNFGYRWRYHKLNQPGAEVDSELMERQFHENMKELGVLGGRTLEVEADYKRDFIKVETAAGEKLDDLIEKWRDHEVEGDNGKERPYSKLADTFNKSFDYISRVKLLEAIKADEAVARTNAHLEKGRKVVIFHSYNVGGSVDPLNGVRQKHPELLNQFESEFPRMTNISFGNLQRPLSLFEQAFGDRVRFYNGDVSDKARNEAKALFNEDGSGVDVIVIQQDAGEAGISLHDISGTNQRVLINIGIPVKPTQMIQIEGRIYRVGVKTDAQFENLTTGTAFERYIFASKIAGRASTAENLGMGELARSLKESISEGYLDAAYKEVGDEIGKGGKEADRAQEISPWDKAKSFYYSNLKRTSNTKSAEGEDYFATPEPLGMKMVEWLQPKGGHRLLEPSVGHGAIGRWFPGNTRNKATEKSYKLASLAEMVFSGDVINEPFEDLNVINKFEGIAMNPPFGRGGKLAYDHIEKAIRHLTNGGRIVALVPDGPAANKRLDKLLIDERYENIYQAGEVALPNGVFDRAGTGVKTKVIILDRFDNPADAPNPQYVSFENAKDVNELFDRIEHTILRDRNEPTLEPVDPSLYMEYEGAARQGRNGDTYRVKMWGELPNDVTQAINEDANQFGARPDRDGRTYYFDNDEARADFAEYAARIIEEAKESGVEIDIEPPKREQSAPSSANNEFFEYTGEVYTTKRGKEFVVTEMKDRQEYETYSKLKELAKDFSGWPRGQKFMFPTEEDALKFNGAAKQLLDSADINLSVGDKSGGMSADDVRAAVEPLINDLHERGTFEVVQSISDLPLNIRIQAKAKLKQSKGENPVLRGINAGDKNYLIADGLSNEKEAVEIFLHEVVGHKAVLDMLGKDGDAIMERIALSYGRKGLADLIKTYGVEPNTKEGRILLGKEKVAHMAEKGEKPALLKRLVAAVRSWLRKYFPSIKWSDNDVLSLISNARQRVENQYMTKVDLDAQSADSRAYINASIKTDIPEDIKKVTEKTQAKPKGQLTLMERAKEYIKGLKDIDGTALKQGLIDSYASIESLEKNVNMGKLLDGAESAYKAALRTANLDSVVEVAMRKGALEYKDGAFQVKKDTKGLLEIFQSIADADQLQLWETYAGAKRAKRIMDEDRKANIVGQKEMMAQRARIKQLRGVAPAEYPGGLAQWQKDMRTAKKAADSAKKKAFQKRERLYTAKDIKKVMDFVNGKPEMKAEFEKAQSEWRKFNKAILDMAEQAGLINSEARAIWEHDDYVPFHRVAEMEDDSGKHPFARKRGLSGQKSGIEQLKGGVEKLNIIESMVRSTTHMIDASFKNVAMQRITDIADGVAMEKLPTSKMEVEERDNMLRELGYDPDAMDAELLNAWSNQLERYNNVGKGTVSVSRNGKLQKYHVTDSGLFTAITQLGPMRVDGLMKIFQIPKRILTTMVTADPGFMAANFMRDTLSTWVTVDAKTTPLYDAIKGASKGIKRDESLWAMMAAGAGGGGYYDTSPDSVRQHLSTLKKGGALHSPKRAWDAWMRIGQATENANRIAVYDAVIKDGGSVAEAAHEAQDVINFSKRGAHPWAQALISMVPFLNARIQGLERLYRGGKTNPKAFFMKGSILMGASLALLAANWDNEDYWELEEWDRDANWHVWVDGEHIKIPKPFEVGAFFGTVPERAFEQLRDDADGKLLAERMGAMMLGTFAMNPTPQLFKPAMEVAKNENGFTGNPILSFGDQYRKPEGQYSPWTSETMKQLANAMPDNAPEWMRSPKRLEYLMRGYFGTLGGYLLGLTDMATSQIVDKPDSPDWTFGKAPVIKRFYSDEVGSNKHVGRFYDMLDETSMLYSEVKALAKEGKTEQANKLMNSNLKKLQLRSYLNKVSKRLSDISSQIKKVYQSPTMTAKEKRKRIDELTKMRNELAQDTSLRYYGLF